LIRPATSTTHSAVMSAMLNRSPAMNSVSPNRCSSRS
jgi:hypothetical protein